MRTHSTLGLPAALHGSLRGAFFDVMVREDDLATGREILREVERPRLETSADDHGALIVWLVLGALGIAAALWLGTLPVGR